MSEAVAGLGKALMEGTWKLFSITVPGFTFSFAQMWLGLLLCSVSLLVVKILFGIGRGPSGDSPRTSSTDNPKISQERRNDEF